MPGRLALIGRVCGCAQQILQALTVGVRESCDKLRNCGSAVRQQALAPALGFLETRLRHAVGTTQFFQSGAYGFGVEIAHQPADELALAAQRAAAAELARKFKRLTQALR